MKNITNRKIVLSKKYVLSCIGVLTILLLSSTGFAKKKPLISLSGGETGKIYFESSNTGFLTDILDGSDNDDRVIVFGELKIPRGVKSKVPAIVLVHGSGGWKQRDKRYLKAFKKMGIATFRLDCFKPRKVKSTVGKQMLIVPEMMTADAFNALNLLSTHPRIDESRIGIMGISKGGMPTLLSAWEPLRQAMVKGDLKFALHIALYSYCFQFEKLNMTGAPILILIGEKDDWVPVERCVEFTKDMKDTGFDCNSIVYPDAPHGFDGTSDIQYVSQGYNSTKCRYVVQSNGVMIETTSGLQIVKETAKEVFEKCTTRGTHFGLNSAAKKKSLEDIKKFVAKKFGL